MKQAVVGLHALEVALPALSYPIQDLAALRGLEYDKLRFGLGLENMAVPDADEDVVTLATQAVVGLMTKQKLSPQHIGRLYLGTESAVDGAKPTATYILSLLESYFAPQFGNNCFEHCDVVDLTFACIGAVDALQNCNDWVANDPVRQAIVVASDTARYRLNSTGEYTQGAGAVALLLRHEPALLSFGKYWGVSTAGVHDFYKPIRSQRKSELVQDILNAAQSTADSAAVLAALTKQEQPLLSNADADLQVHDDTPVFDGQYSNQCYLDRVQGALASFSALSGATDLLSERWQGLLFHLPYALQGKRMASSALMRELIALGRWSSLFPDIPVEEADEKAFAKSDYYKDFVAHKLAPAHLASMQVGNLYTGSIFLALASWLDAQKDQAISGKLGFIAYGSGSKSKVFEGELQPQWQAAAAHIQLHSKLTNREVIDSNTYEKLHIGEEDVMAKKAKLAQKIGYRTDGPTPWLLTYQLNSTINV
jgi:hydroxymethylglutaryl-CoA synthase